MGPPRGARVLGASGSQCSGAGLCSPHPCRGPWNPRMQPVPAPRSLPHPRRQGQKHTPGREDLRFRPGAETTARVMTHLATLSPGLLTEHLWSATHGCPHGPHHRLQPAPSPPAAGGASEANEGTAPQSPRFPVWADGPSWRPQPGGGVCPWGPSIWTLGAGGEGSVLTSWGDRE